MRACVWVRAFVCLCGRGWLLFYLKFYQQNNFTILDFILLRDFSNTRFGTNASISDPMVDLDEQPVKILSRFTPLQFSRWHTFHLCLPFFRVGTCEIFILIGVSFIVMFFRAFPALIFLFLSLFVFFLLVFFFYSISSSILILCLIKFHNFANTPTGRALFDFWSDCRFGWAAGKFSLSFTSLQFMSAIVFLVGVPWRDFFI